MRSRLPERLLTLGLLVASSGCGESEKPSALPVNDDFSDCSTGWSTDRDAFVSLSCTAGAYRVLIKNPRLPQNARIFFDRGAKSLSVGADATRRAGPRTVGRGGFLAYGVGCWKSPTRGYVFVISPDGAWGIEKVTGNRPPTPLAESETADAVPRLARTNRIRGICVSGGRQPTRLALYVNGKRLASAEDRAGFDAFPGFGFFVLSNKAGTDVRFDNLVARTATGAEVRDARTASTICKRDGIRYAGTTAQGASVCFTLTPDGDRLVETGFSFVPASGCPNRGVGEVYSDFTGRVDASGSVRNPDGLTATIRGANASGVLEDPTICPGKKFRWSARRQS
jgi:hypothetical protein